MVYKPLAKLSDDELSKLLQESNLDQPSGSKRAITGIDLYLFISMFQIEVGSNPVSIKLLWQLYKEWSKKPVIKKKFFKFIKDLLPHDENDNILLNKSLFNISKDLEDYLTSKIKYKVKYDSENKHFTNFLKKHIIESGNTWISTSLLFEAYRVWVKRIRKSNTLGFEQFEQFCKHYFKFTENKQLTKVALGVERIKWPKSKSLNETLRKNNL